MLLILESFLIVFVWSR